MGKQVTLSRLSNTHEIQLGRTRPGSTHCRTNRDGNGLSHTPHTIITTTKGPTMSNYDIAKHAVAGRRRMLQIGEETAQQVAELTAELLRDAGPAPSATDRVVAEQIAAATVAARRRRAQGRDDSAFRRQLTALLKTAGGAFAARPASPTITQTAETESAS
jgi:hypothetical protein